MIASGRAEILPFDVQRGHRTLSRYLGPEEAQWAARFRHYLYRDRIEAGTVWIYLYPTSIKATDLSYQVSGIAC